MRLRFWKKKPTVRYTGGFKIEPQRCEFCGKSEDEVYLVHAHVRMPSLIEPISYCSDCFGGETPRWL